MKRIVPPLSFVVLLLGTTESWAQKPEPAPKKKYEFAHERTISKTYTASSGDKLDIENQFGNVVVKTWNRGEVKVDVKIEVSSNVKEAADKIFENIDVEHSKNGNKIQFKTELNAKDEKGFKGKHNNSMSIDYEVSMPANLQLDLENKFGKTTLPDLQGRVNIQQEFGNLVAGKLANPGNIEVRYGGVVIESAVNGKYEFQFASDETTIKNLSGKADLEIQYCKSGNVVINAVNIGELKVDAQYSDVAIVVPKNMSAGISIETHFGSFTNKSSFSLKKEDDDDDDDKDDKRIKTPKFNSSYKGKAGDGKNKIELDANFSEIILSHETPPAKEKKKKVTNI
jgi:hypothetical protein